MYKKAISGLLLINLILLAGVFCIEGITYNRKAAIATFDTKLDEIQLDRAVVADQKSSTMGMVFRAASDQRVVDCGVLTPKVVEADFPKLYQLSDTDYDILLRIVEAEAGGEDMNGRLLVANVVLNRVKSEQFPDTVSEVVLQQTDSGYQFSPVGSGSIWKVTVSEETIEAVERALQGEDISLGALYFAARKYADKERMKWFDENLTFLFQHGGHEFFTG